MESQILKAGKFNSASLDRSEVEFTGRDSEPSRRGMEKLDMVLRGREWAGHKCRTDRHSLGLIGD